VNAAPVADAAANTDGSESAEQPVRPRLRRR